MYSEKSLFHTTSDPMKEPTIEEIDLDGIFSASDTHAEAWKIVSAEKLIKVWKIDLATSRHTVNTTSQRRKRSDYLTFPRN